MLAVSLSTKHFSSSATHQTWLHKLCNILLIFLLMLLFCAFREKKQDGSFDLSINLILELVRHGRKQLRHIFNTLRTGDADLRF